MEAKRSARSLNSRPWWVAVALKLTAAVAIAIAGTWWHARDAEAASLQVRVYSSLEPSSGLFEYGKHYNETNVAFGARDFNFDGDEGAGVYLRLNLYQTQTYYVRYHVWPKPNDSHGMYAKLAQYIDGEWIDIGGTELHFLHSTQVTEDWTGYILYANESIGWYMGVTCVSACGTSLYHSHLSGDVGTTSLMTLAYFSADACWTNTEESFQCPSDYPDHATCSSSSGTASKSGVISEYLCATWSKEYRSTSDVIFNVWY